MAHTKSISPQVAVKKKKAIVKVGRRRSPLSVKEPGPASSRKNREKAKPAEKEEEVPQLSGPTHQEPSLQLNTSPEQVSETPTRDGQGFEQTADPHDELLVTLDRRRLPDRRSGEDRRQQNIPVAGERRQLERRAKVPRRRQIDPTTCERDYTPEEIEFMIALDEYKRSSGRMFPTCSEILEVLKKLGYEKRVLPPAEQGEAGTSSETSPETAPTEPHT
ncbi:MAG: hypothetical protein ACUVQG_10640 [Thermogutta sp.]